MRSASDRQIANLGIAAQRAVIRQKATGSEDRSRYDWFAESCPCGLEIGTCQIHPRARRNQRPPDGDWRTVLFCCGRGFGKTKAGIEWLRYQIESGRAKRAAIVGSTAADVRDILVEGKSGILSISPPWFMPMYEPSKRRLTWPNGAVAALYSAEEPRRLRGPEHDVALCDELAAWEYPETFDMLELGLRIGDNPQMFIATTPKPTKLMKSLVADPKIQIIRGSTYDNRPNLSPKFFEAVVAKYAGSRLGQQEIDAELLETSEGAWFARFDKNKHVKIEAEYHPHWGPVHLAIDCGTSMTTGAVWFQAQQLDRYQHRVRIFGEYCAIGNYSAENARAIKAHGDGLPCGGRADIVRLDPAAVARSGLGPAAFGEYERVFGSRIAKAPGGSVNDGLDLIECLLDTNCLWTHPRCTRMIESWQNYKRDERGGEFIDRPAPDQSPHEDMMDALRYGLKDRFPEGREIAKRFAQKHVGQLY